MAQVPHAGDGVALTPVAAEHDADTEFLDKMRGWLMTVAALFVNMAFTAVLHPPDWLKTEWYRSGFKLKHRPPSRHAADQGAATGGEMTRALLFLFFNVATFAAALVLVLVLLYVRKPSSAKRVMTFATLMLTAISVLVAGAFAVASADNWLVIVVVCSFTVVVCFVIVFCVIMAALVKLLTCFSWELSV